MDFYKEYIKYKSKYLEIKKKLAVSIIKTRY